MVVAWTVAPPAASYLRWWSGKLDLLPVPWQGELRGGDGRGDDGGDVGKQLGRPGQLGLLQLGLLQLGLLQLDLLQLGLLQLGRLQLGLLLSLGGIGDERGQVAETIAGR